MLYHVKPLCHTGHDDHRGHTNYRICDHCGHYSTVVTHAITGVTTVPQLSNWSQGLHDVCEFSAKYRKVATQSINIFKSTDMHGKNLFKVFFIW